ncbi:signal peptidase I [Puccinia sorghi]|uniref:Mitochondrial inner membrane protease subunit n=1 Tax=Puccinia sorghi TaxID=27349 RepID=A0A0L6UC59_9BASI|nr:signal peptidase I [Puccinia sorghi]
MIQSSTFLTTLHLLKRSVQVAAGVTLFKDKVGDLRWCEGASMLPTLNATGDLLVQIPLSSIFNLRHQAIQASDTSKNSSRLREPTTVDQLNLNRGDLVNFVSPLNPSVLACKRIIGLPGDKILVDQQPKHSHSSPDSSWQLSNAGYDYTHKTLLTVPDGHLWLQGDNYAVSVDSRTYGPVPIGLVSGKIIARVWPNFCWLSKPFQYK